jgi:Leucine-rich repeat (LRR) protein
VPYCGTDPVYCLGCESVGVCVEDFSRISAAMALISRSTIEAPEEGPPASANLLGSTARSELQPKRPQSSGDKNKRLHSTRPFIPADVVQNTAEYLGRIAGLLSFRGVSTEWQGAVSDAVGFLNGRCWNRLECKRPFSPVDSDELWTRLRLDGAGVVARCAVLCLRPRLATVTCPGYRFVWFPLRLLGETNETLVTLSLHDYTRSIDDLSCLLGCVALRELSLQDTQVTNESFVGLGPLLARLHKLDLSWCKQLRAISNLAPATSLRELNLAITNVEDLGGLEKLVALETLDVTGTNIRTEDLSILRQCPRLVTLSADGDIFALGGFMHTLAPSLVDCRLHLDRLVGVLDSRSLSGLSRSTVLKVHRADNASLRSLEEIPSLEQLDLGDTGVNDVRSLASCRALRILTLRDTWVTNVGIIGLERIATLEVLILARISHITSVTSLRHCTALRELILDETRVTDAGIAGLECIVTLTKLSLALTNVASVSSLRHSPSLRELNISNTGVTAAGTTGLDEIGTLECFKAGGRTQLDASTLRRCRSLREVDLSRLCLNLSGVLDALADLSTLETLSLSHCREVRDVKALARSVSLRRLDLEGSAVSDADIAGLERIPSLTSVSLAACESITNVTNLFNSKSLRRLTLSSSSVNEAGLVGLELAPALEFVDLVHCAGVVDIAAVVQRAADRTVKVTQAMLHMSGISSNS